MMIHRHDHGRKHTIWLFKSCRLSNNMLLSLSIRSWYSATICEYGRKQCQEVENVMVVVFSHGFS